MVSIPELSVLQSLCQVTSDMIVASISPIVIWPLKLFQHFHWLKEAIRSCQNVKYCYIKCVLNDASQPHKTLFVSDEAPMSVEG